MNTERMLQLADHLDHTSPKKFAMQYWFASRRARHLSFVSGGTMDPQDLPKKCGTTGCVAAHALLIAGDHKAYDPGIQARQWLNLTNTEANHLFNGEFAPRKYKGSSIGIATPKQAAREIRAMVERYNRTGSGV